MSTPAGGYPQTPGGGSAGGSGSGGGPGSGGGLGSGAGFDDATPAEPTVLLADDQALVRTGFRMILTGGGLRPAAASPRDGATGRCAGQPRP